MDFITCLPKSEEKNVIMVFVDRLIMYAHFCSPSRPFSARTVVVAFMNIVQKLHWNLKMIVSDRDPIFTEKIGLNYFLFWVATWLTIHLITLSPMGRQI